MRAVGDNRILSNIDGISSEKITGFTWLIGGLYAGLTGALIATFSVVHPYLGILNWILIFAIVYVGGVGSVYGAMIAGILLLETKSVITLFANPYYGSIIAFVVLIIALIYRPKGIMGE